MEVPLRHTGTITEVTPQVHDPERVSVFIDGAFAFGIARLLAAELGLNAGRQLSAEDLERLLALEEAERATEAALRFLGYRPRSEREVRDRLRRRGYSDQAIGATVERLRGWRYLDDAEFARFWVENRNEHQPRGRRRLRSELRAKGVEADLAARVIEEAAGDERPAALDLARKRAANLQTLDPVTRRRRLAAYLQRRGYDWDVIKPVLDTVLGEGDDSAPE